MSKNGNGRTYRRRIRRHLTTDGVNLDVVADVNLAYSAASTGSTTSTSSVQSVAVTQSGSPSDGTSFRGRAEREPDTSGVAAAPDRKHHHKKKEQS